MDKYKEWTKVSDTPLLSGDNWKEITYNKKIVCGSCGSNNTICIYRKATGSIICAEIREEFYCNDCGKFTSYYLDYES